MPDRRMAAWAGRGAGILLLLSLAFPYWQAEVFAPQYPGGLRAKMYAFRVGGDAQEIDNLNHYIGLSRLDQFGRLERIASVPVAVTLAFLCWILAGLQRRKLQWLIFLAVLAYPFAFVADMAYWMRYASTHLDPTAPLKIKAFTIPIWGSGTIAQFRSVVGPQAGFYLVLAALVLLAVALARSGQTTSEEPRQARALLGAALAALLGTSAPGRAHAEPPPLQERIARAAPGAVIDLAPGVYRAPIVIDKPLTLQGQGKAVIHANGQGTVITVRAAGVTLDGLVIQGSGESLLYEDSGVRVEAPNARIRNCRIEDVLFGVFLTNAPDAVLEDNVIRGKPIDLGQRGDLVRLWYSDRPVMRRNRLTAGRDTVLWFSNGSVFEDNVVEGGRYGLHFMYTHRARVAGNRFFDNSVGAYVMYSKDVVIEKNRFEKNRGPSGSGLGLKESDAVAVLDNVFVNNRQGVFIDQSPTVPEESNRWQGNLIAFNDIGVAMLPGVQGNVFTRNAFNDNLQQVSVQGGGPLRGNLWAENGRGNYWSDYVGYGLKGALVGRVPHSAGNAFENLADHVPFARFFAFTPAAQALDIAGRAFPIFKPKPKLVDPAPLLAPPFQGQGTEKSSFQAAAMRLPLAILALPVLLATALERKRRVRGGAPPAGAPGDAGPVLEVADLRKSFGPQEVLRGVNLSLQRGESLALWGPNGSGKSTFIKCLLGLQPYQGDIRIFGLENRRAGHIARARVGYLPQEAAWYDWTVQEAMEFVCRVRGVALDRIQGTLAACHLEGEERKAIRALSGGMKQKLALAQALVARPELLVLDEPCSNLDLKSRLEILDTLRHKRGACALLLTSHHLDEVDALADRVLWMETGQPAPLLDLAAFHERVGKQQPLWVRLEQENVSERAMEFLREKGFRISPDGNGFFVHVGPRNKMEVVRLLESCGFQVRDLRQEAIS